MAVERRNHHRIQCRLACEVKLGRTRLRGRVLDISEGGLCILTPERLAKEAKVRVTIEIPSVGPIDLEATVWHQRRVKQKFSGGRGWATGLILDKSDPAYEALVDPTEALTDPTAVQTESIPGVARGEADLEAELVGELDEASSIYRLHVKAVGSNRTRMLTISAASAEAARDSVLAELPGEWTVLDVAMRTATARSSTTRMR
jgi:hypothetical protein